MKKRLFIFTSNVMSNSFVYSIRPWDKWVDGNIKQKLLNESRSALGQRTGDSVPAATNWREKPVSPFERLPKDT